MLRVSCLCNSPPEHLKIQVWGFLSIFSAASFSSSASRLYFGLKKAMKTTPVTKAVPVKRYIDPVYCWMVPLGLSLHFSLPLFAVSVAKAWQITIRIMPVACLSKREKQGLPLMFSLDMWSCMYTVSTLCSESIVFYVKGGRRGGPYVKGGTK